MQSISYVLQQGNRTAQRHAKPLSILSVPASKDKAIYASGSIYTSVNTYIIAYEEPRTRALHVCVLIRACIALTIKLYISVGVTLKLQSTPTHTHIEGARSAHTLDVFTGTVTVLYVHLMYKTQ